MFIVIKFVSFPLLYLWITRAAGQAGSCEFNVIARNFSMSLNSPGYPSTYENNLDCEWSISARTGHFIRLVFEEFNTETNFDILRITGTSIPVELSGFLTQNVFYSESNNLVVNFTSDGSYTDTGFAATFIEIDSLPIHTSTRGSEIPSPSIPAPATTTTAITAIQGGNCGFTSTATDINQTISSPGWPNQYQSNEACEWTLTARDGYHVQLTFHSFATEPIYDVLVLVGSSSTSSRLSGSLETNTFYSVNSTLTLRFTSDGSLQRNGFTASFAEIDLIPTLMDERCGYNVTVTDSKETLATPHWPNNYSPNSNCEWHLTTEQGYQVQLKIESIDTEEKFDTFTIIGASDEQITLSSSPRIAGSFYSLNQSLIVKFISDDTVNYGGVMASFTRVLQRDVPLFTAVTRACSFNLTAENITKYVASPGWPDSYFYDLDCQWNLKASFGGHVNLTFEIFHTEKKEDFVRVIGSQQNPLLLYSGTIQPDPFYSLFDNLTLIFKTSPLRNFLGFRASFKEIKEFPENLPNISTYTCDNGDMIKADQVCDGIIDCDGSDEVRSGFDCQAISYEQLNCTVASSRLRTCILNKEAVCNGSFEIHDNQPCYLNCSSHYNCDDGKCEERSTVCDQNKCNGCSEDNEWGTGIGFQCIRSGKMCLLPQQLLWDGIKDCDQGEDLCYIHAIYKDGRDLRNASTKFDHSRCFKCFDGSIIIPRSKVCDGVFQCSDLSDECLCEEEVPSLCQHVIEKTTNQYSNLNASRATCSIGKVMCHDGKCISRQNICDSIGDCSDNMDERESYCNGTLSCAFALSSDQGKSCRCPEYDCKKAKYAEIVEPIENVHAHACDRNRECPPADRFKIIIGGYLKRNWKTGVGFPADECEAQCGEIANISCTTEANGDIYNDTQTQRKHLCTLTSRPIEVNKCDGIRDCEQEVHDESNCPGRHYCSNGERLSIPSQEVCDGRVHCEDGSDETYSSCPERLFCPSLSNALVSIDASKVCDEHIDCDNNMDEINCTNDGRFYCEHGNPLFVLRRQIFDGRQDCDDLSDECPTASEAKNEDIFSSRYHLIANPILRYLVWIMGIFALFGNLVVIVGEGKSLSKITKQRGSTAGIANHMLVFNLALADILMGVYLIMLGIAGAVYDGTFCLHEAAWLSSVACSTMGVLVVLSSETSVITMMILTSCRLYAISEPFKAREKPTRRFLIACISSAWLISLFIALLPFVPRFESVFADKVLISNNPFFQNATVTLDSAKVWSKKMLTYHPQYENSFEDKIKLIRGASSWDDLQRILEEPAVSKFLNITKRFGFYSANSVCIPRLFVTRQDNAWIFSISITFVNFFAFIYVASAYVYILVIANKERKQRTKLTTKNRNNEKSNKELHKKVLRLIATDFSCWVPISIMTFINFSGFRLFDIAYVISAIVLLPINSALNPILYSDFVDTIIWKVKKRIKKLTSETKDSSNCNRQAKENTPL